MNDYMRLRAADISAPVEGAKTIDRAALEAALAQWSADGHPRLVRHSEIIAAAARAHLATLPEPPKTKMMWGVSAGAEMGWVHFHSFHAALKALECEAEAGKRAVTIQYREVPV